MGKEYITDSIEISEGIIDSDGEIGTGGQLLSSTGSGILWVDDNSVKPYVKTRLTSNNTINNSTTLAEFSVINTTPLENSGFSLTSNKIVYPSGASGAGIYAVDVMAYYTSSSPRVNVGLQVSVNGTFTGEEAAMGYIRASSGHNQASLTWSSIVEVPANGYIGIGFVRLANSGTCTLDSNKSAVSVYKIS